ncbi:hypothetical protein [Leisingera sp.]|uniref:hypothetical protein n=1 Tax=Leisingera sp. TaxID=1879318 RepID=UPI002B274B85|nr:hypothetical protein [Leisingera sp.]
MKNAFTHVLGLLLTLSLALYGSIGMAKVGANAVFTMEICADGVAKTVSFDANDNPVEPAQFCPECLTCCQTVGVLVPTIWSLIPSLNRLGMEVVNPVAKDPIVNKRNLYPAPRGPPVVQFSMPRLITFDLSAGGRMMRSDGRPMLKDANA